MVTNDYLKYRGQEKGTGTEIEATSCSRYRRAAELLKRGLPGTPEQAFGILSDDGVKMQEMTVQQMVMCPATGFMQASVPE